MGVEVYPSRLRASLEELNRSLEPVISNAEPLKGEIMTFIGTDDLKSLAFGSKKDYMARGHLPAINAQISAISEFIEANNTHIRCIDSYLSGEGYLSEDRLNYQINQLSRFIETSESLQLSGVTATLEGRRQSCMMKLEHLHDFDTATSGLYDGAAATFAYASALVGALEQTTFNPTTRTYTMPVSTVVIPVEKEFIQMMEEQYGFDKKTAKIMLKVYDQLVKRYPNATQQEIDWRYTRLMGGFQYDGIEWEQTAGLATYYDSVLGQKKKTEAWYFMKYLEIPKEEYDFLRYKVRVQYAITGKGEEDSSYESIRKKYLPDYMKSMEKALGRKLSEEEFEQLWNEQSASMKGKGDYAHQQITTASILATDLSKSGILTDIYFGGDDAKREDMAGWLGDATLIPIGTAFPSFGPDDYIADLDAENITYIMKEENYSYWEACSKYYQEVGKDYTRAEKFLEHTDIDSVKKDIFDNLTRTEIAKENVIPEYSENWLTEEEKIEAEVKRFDELTSEKGQMEKLKEIAPDTYNFIKSLEEPKKYHEMRR